MIVGVSRQAQRQLIRLCLQPLDRCWRVADSSRLSASIRYGRPLGIRSSLFALFVFG